jgi:hypothetical protein
MQQSMMQGLTARIDTLTQLVDQVVLLTQLEGKEQKGEGGDKEGAGEGAGAGGATAAGGGAEGPGEEQRGGEAAGVDGGDESGAAGGGVVSRSSSNVSWGEGDLGRQGSQPRKNSRYTAQVSSSAVRLLEGHSCSSM